MELDSGRGRWERKGRGGGRRKGRREKRAHGQTLFAEFPGIEILPVGQDRVRANEGSVVEIRERFERRFVRHVGSFVGRFGRGSNG